MDLSKPFVIAITRQIGSGGSYIGKLLAKELNIFYANHEIIRLVSKELSFPESDLKDIDQKTKSFWENFLHFNALSNDLVDGKLFTPTSEELFAAESKIIEKIVQEQSAVIIGRCAYYLLQNHPNHLSIFLHADVDFRCKRVQQNHSLSVQQAMDLVAQSDKDRANYNNTFTGNKWCDATQYDLTFDTGKIGIEKSVELILNYLKLV